MLRKCKKSLNVFIICQNKFKLLIYILKGKVHGKKDVANNLANYLQKPARNLNHRNLQSSNYPDSYQ